MSRYADIAQEKPLMNEAEHPAAHKNLIERILTARVYDVAQETPLDKAKNLSKSKYKQETNLQQISIS